MIHPMLTRLFPTSAVPKIGWFERSSAPKRGDRSTARQVTLLLAMTLGLGAGSLAEQVRAAEPMNEGQAQSISVPPTSLMLAQAVPGGVLRLNDSGEAVADLQRRLTQLGFFSDEITGFFGTATQAAVTQFQQANGLTPDGVVGAATQAAMELGGSASAGNAPRDLLQLNDSGEQVAELQRRLASLGFYNGSISGVFDGATQFAVINFQQANSLTADGVVGAETTVALRRASGSAGQNSAPAPVFPTPSTPAPGAAGSGSLLRVGSSGAAVSTLQTQLQSLGIYKGTITGVYDAQTEAAVTAFQRSRGLVADGIAGPQVNSALSSTTGINSTTGQNTAIQPNSPAQAQYIQQVQQAQAAAEQARQEAEQARLEAEKVRLVYQQNLQEGRYSTVELQRRLQANGYNPGDVSGIMTPTTESAVSEAQRSYGLSEGDFLGTGGMPLF